MAPEARAEGATAPRASVDRPRPEHPRAPSPEPQEAPAQAAGHMEHPNKRPRTFSGDGDNDDIMATQDPEQGNGERAHTRETRATAKNVSKIQPVLRQRSGKTQQPEDDEEDELSGGVTTSHE